MLRFDKLMNNFWGPFLMRFEVPEKNQPLVDDFKNWELFFVDNIKDGDWLNGGKEGPSMIDIHAFPMAERLVMLENSPWDNRLPEFKTTCPTIIEYVHRFRKHPKMAPYVME